MYHPAWRYPNDGNDVPIDQGYQPFLWASEWYRLFKGDPNDKRASLTWRDLFAMARATAHVYYTPTDELFRPLNYTIEMAANDAEAQPNIQDWPGFEDVIENILNDILYDEPVGSYLWSIQELTKGRILFGPGLGDDFKYGGWGLNMDQADGYYQCDEPTTPEAIPNCTFITPADANAIVQSDLRAGPLFSKNPNYANEGLYSSQTVADLMPASQEELLANEIPALTFAAGHRGVQEIRVPKPDRDVDIRKKYAVNKPWPLDRLNGYEWRHSDVYRISYQYLHLLYDDFNLKAKGE